MADLHNPLFQMMLRGNSRTSHTPLKSLTSSEEFWGKQNNPLLDVAG